MFAQVINISQERAKKRKAYLAKNAAKLDQFLYEFMAKHLSYDFADIAKLYHANQNQLQQETWDYMELREAVGNLLAENIVPQIYLELKTRRWFDPRWVGPEQITERCLSIFVLGNVNAANQ